MDMEGVIKFSCKHENRQLSARVYGPLADKLDAWRTILMHSRLIGQDPDRYFGAGFGNLSGRLTPPSLSKGYRRFLISGTQTGVMETLKNRGLCAVEEYDLRENSVRSTGPVLPSSESLTHAAIYDLSTSIRFVFHVHSPQIWKKASILRLPETREHIAYGTQEMAFEVQELYRSTGLSESRVLAMRGHEDGIIGFGHTAREAGVAIIGALAAAYELP